MKVFPVIQTPSPQIAESQAYDAMEGGADGIYIRSDPSTMPNIFNAVSDALPEAYVGVNYATEPNRAFYELGTSLQAKKLIRTPDGLWVDDLAAETKSIREAKRRIVGMSQMDYLGGIAAAGTSSETNNHADVLWQTQRYSSRAEVIVTTGKSIEAHDPPDLDKVATIRLAIGTKLLAMYCRPERAKLKEFSPAIKVLLYPVEAGQYGNGAGKGLPDLAAFKRLVAVAHKL